MNLTPDFTRDRWGRPLIVPAGGGPAEPFTRSSSAAKTVEDTFNLEKWARRNVAFGMSRDSSLVARVLAIAGDPSTWDQADKTAVNEIVEAASAVASAHKGADIGSAVHLMTERLDRGEQFDAGSYTATLAAYTATLAAAGLDVQEIECRMVCDALRMAGTADRIVRCRDGLYRILDIKTGATVDYGALGWAAQLAAYAHSELYDTATDLRLPTPPLDKTVGIICHLPAGQGQCTLYEIDLVAGFRAAELANEIRAVRTAAKRWIAPLPAPLRDPSDQRAKELLTPQQTKAALNSTPDEGATVTADRVGKLRARYDLLDPQERTWCATVAREANQAGVPFYLTEQPTERRLWLYQSLVLLAEYGPPGTDANLLRRLCADMTGTDAPLFPSVTVGHAFGSLTADQARCLVKVCGQLEAAVADDGTIILHNPTPQHIGA